MSAVAESFGGNHLVILEDKEEAAYVLNDLETFLPDKRVVFSLVQHVFLTRQS